LELFGWLLSTSGRRSAWHHRNAGVEKAERSSTPICCVDFVIGLLGPVGFTVVSPPTWFDTTEIRGAAKAERTFAPLS